jgi:uncharacterized surface protein with fasciclin (FAS1) repeats
MKTMTSLNLFCFQGTKLEEELKKGFEDKVTLLVPKPSSILRMSREKLDSILKDKDLSDKILRNHIISGKLSLFGHPGLL